MRIDVHNHFFPPAYLRLLEDRADGVRVRTDRDGRRYLEEGGTRLATLTPPMTALEDRLAMMREQEIDIQVISLTSPNVYCFAADDAIAAARQVNDEYAAIKERHRDRFRCLASVPLGTGAEVEELDRAITSSGSTASSSGPTCTAGPSTTPLSKPSGGVPTSWRCPCSCIR